MQRLFIILISTMLVTFGTAAQTVPESFVPCDTYGEPPEHASFNAGPWAARLMLAISDDGLTFVRTGQVLAEQADVPDVIVTPEGEIRAYFIVWCPTPLQNRIAVASSLDAETWTYRTVEITYPSTMQTIGMPADPTVEFTDDGRYRLYFTSQLPPSPVPGSYSAVSEDGFTFVLEEEPRVLLADRNALDVNVLKIGDMWHYFAGGVPGENIHAVSSDGLTFTRVEDFVRDSIIMSNGIAIDGGFRYFGFQQRPGVPSRIVSFFTADGETWTLEDGARLDADPDSPDEQEGVKDPAVTRLPDGRYLMIYVTVNPDFPLEKGAPPQGTPGQPPGQ